MTQDFVLHSFHLTTIMVASVIGVLLLCAFLVVAQAAEDGRQNLRQQRETRARRLRYVNGAKDVIPTPLPQWRRDAPPASAPWLPSKSECLHNQVGPFHIFLSHNWAQGQVIIGSDLTSFCC